MVLLDVRGISPVTDYMILATGTSPRQMQSSIDHLDEIARDFNQSSISRSGPGDTNWALIDFFNVLVHVFDQEAREYYDLDTLWGDAPTLEWRKSPAK